MQLLSNFNETHWSSADITLTNMKARDISLTQLAYFVRSAETGSMTEAAATLYVAQSAVSTAIANLENSLGTALFIRRRAKGLLLTSAGQQFLIRARGLLADLDDAVDELSPDRMIGRFTAGCFPTLAPFYLPDIVAGLTSDYPQLHVQILELDASQVGEALHNRSVEVALTYDLGLGPDIHRELLARIPLYAAVAASHPLANRKRMSIAELADEPMVLLDLPASRDYFLRAFAAAGFAPNIRYRFSSFESVRAMVARGHGFTALNQRPAANITYDGSELAVIELDSELPALDVVLATTTPAHLLTMKARAFADACRTRVYH